MIPKKIYGQKLPILSILLSQQLSTIDQQFLLLYQLPIESVDYLSSKITQNDPKNKIFEIYNGVASCIPRFCASVLTSPPYAFRAHLSACILWKKSAAVILRSSAVRLIILFLPALRFYKKERSVCFPIRFAYR